MRRGAAMGAPLVSPAGAGCGRGAGSRPAPRGRPSRRRGAGDRGASPRHPTAAAGRYDPIHELRAVHGRGARGGAAGRRARRARGRRDRRHERGDGRPGLEPGRRDGRPDGARRDRRAARGRPQAGDAAPHRRHDLHHPRAVPDVRRRDAGVRRRGARLRGPEPGRRGRRARSSSSPSTRRSAAGSTSCPGSAARRRRSSWAPSTSPRPAPDARRRPRLRRASERRRSGTGAVSAARPWPLLSSRAERCPSG